MLRRSFLATLSAALAPSGAAGRGAYPDIRADVDFPFPLLEVPAARALESWKELAARPGAPRPVLVGARDSAESHAEAVKEFGKPASVILELARALNFPIDLAEMRRKDREEGDAYLRSLPPDQVLYELWDEKGARPVTVREALAEPDEPFPLGEWPTTMPVPAPFTPATRPESTTACIALLPTADSAEAAAWLNFGSWNECPPPEYHVAAFRSWRDRYGAELVECGADVVQLRVTSRPKTREEALALAREHYDYCSDIVVQGVGSISELAALLMVSDVWSFWWD